MARRQRGVTAKDLVDEVKARLAQKIAEEIDRAASAQALRDVGPVLEKLREAAIKAGPLGEAWAKRIDRELAALRRRAKTR